MKAARAARAAFGARQRAPRGVREGYLGCALACRSAGGRCHNHGDRLTEAGNHPSPGRPSLRGRSLTGSRRPSATARNHASDSNSKRPASTHPPFPILPEAPRYRTTPGSKSPNQVIFRGRQPGAHRRPPTRQRHDRGVTPAEPLIDQRFRSRCGPGLTASVAPLAAIRLGTLITLPPPLWRGEPDERVATHCPSTESHPLARGAERRFQGGGRSRLRIRSWTLSAFVPR